MNQYDRENLNFIMRSSAEVLLDWWDNIDDDDKMYASDLLKKYKEELTLRDQLYSDDLPESVDQAARYLTKFRLRK